MVHLAFSPDGSCLAVASLDQKCYLTTSSDLAKLQTFKGHTSSVRELAVPAALVDLAGWLAAWRCR